jgi:6-phospho-3-hexuloisomerase
VNEEQRFHNLAASVQDEIARVVSAADPDEVSAFIACLLNAERIFIAGNGRTGLQMKAFAMRLMHLGLTVHVVGEVTTPGLQPKNVLVIGSSSGSSDSLAAYARKAGALGATVAALTSSRESIVAQAAGTHIYLPALPLQVDGTGVPRKILPLGGLFENALGVVLDVVILLLMEKLEITEKEMSFRHTNLE